jgi:anti-sigma B factor antagonist
LKTARSNSYSSGEVSGENGAHHEDARPAEEVMRMTLQMPLAAESLGIEVCEGGERTVVKLEGELDAATAPRLYATFAELSRRGISEVDLDLSKLEFMDSSGLSVVVAEHRRARDDGGGLVILLPNRRVIRLFQMSGLMSYLVVQPKMSV